MADLLEKILRYKKEELESLQRKVRPADVRHQAADAEPARDFTQALTPGPSPAGGRGEIHIIAEIKKASPSAGVMRENYDPVGIALQYEEHGAAALSILTDRHFFQGDLQHIRQVKALARLPVLRKDFIFDAYQIYEARGAGADAVLLIVRILGESQLKDYLALSRELGMAALVEAHDEADLDRAIRLKDGIIGINNRNLDTLKVDLGLSERLAPKVVGAGLVVSESGIATRDDIERLKKVGISSFLIGESLLRAKNPGEKLREFL